MKSGLAFGLGVLFGAGGAGLVVHTILKQHYSQIADEEIASCRQAFTEENVKLRKELENKKAEEKKAAAVEAVKKYNPEPGAEAAVSAPAPAKTSKPTVPTGWKAPYVMDPAEFDAMDNPHKTLGLKYYPGEGIVARAENDEPVTMEELDSMVGREALTHFGEYGEQDRVCVRNDNWGVDYEICIQGRKYEEVLKEKPWLKK